MSKSQNFFSAFWLLIFCAIFSFVNIAYSEDQKILDTVTEEEKADLKKSEDPIGKIVASLLKPKFFMETVCQKPMLNPRRNVWALADGSNVLGSAYATWIGPKLPDLRGVFLRGLDDMDTFKGPANIDPYSSENNGKKRKAGSFQEDKIGKHKHRISTRTADTGIGGPKLPYRRGGTSGEWWSEDNPDASIETRPKNVAVYYYIKINYRTTPCP